MEIETPKKKETNPDIFDSEASSPALDTSRLAHTMAFSMRPALEMDNNWTIIRVQQKYEPKDIALHLLLVHSTRF